MLIDVRSGGSNNFRTYGGCADFRIAGNAVAHKRTGLRLQTYRSDVRAPGFFAKIKKIFKKIARGVGRGIRNYYADPVPTPLELKFREFLLRQDDMGPIVGRRALAGEMAKRCGKLHSAALKAGSADVKQAVAAALATYIVAYLRWNYDMSLCSQACVRLRWKLAKMLKDWSAE